jgi:hypothetical protein
MLSSEFLQEMGALLRSLEQKVRTEPDVRSADPADQIERAIIALVQIRLEMKSSGTDRD